MLSGCRHDCLMAGPAPTDGVDEVTAAEDGAFVKKADAKEGPFLPTARRPIPANEVKRSMRCVETITFYLQSSTDD